MGYPGLLSDQGTVVAVKPIQLAAAQRPFGDIGGKYLKAEYRILGPHSGNQIVILSMVVGALAVLPRLDVRNFPPGAAEAKANRFWKGRIFLYPAPGRRSMHAKARRNLCIGQIDG